VLKKGTLMDATLVAATHAPPTFSAGAGAEPAAEAAQRPDCPPPGAGGGVFSQLKRHFGWARTRCDTLARNTTDLFAALAMLNLKRAVVRMTP